MAKSEKLCDVKIYLRESITDEDGNRTFQSASINYLTEEETANLMKQLEVATGNALVKLEVSSKIIQREDFDDIDRAYQCVMIRPEQILYVDVFDSDADE